MASLGDDLAAIRREQDLRIEDLQDIIKLDPAILRAIEDDSIFENVNINNTYVRSYVRSYAKAVQIEEANIVRALNERQAGTYDGGLKPPSPQNDEELKKGAKNDVKSEQSDMVHDHSPKYSSGKSSNKVTNRPAKEKATSSEKNVFTDWATIGKKTRPAEKKQTIPTWLLITLIAAAILVLAFLLYGYFNNEPTNSNEETAPTATEQPAIPQDSLQESLLANENSPQNEISITASNSLADTLSITVVAATGKLEPVRVYTDIMDTLNPYWIEISDSMRFEFIDTFRVRATGQFDRMKLIFDGYEIENYYEQFYNSETGLVVLSRTIIESGERL